MALDKGPDSISVNRPLIIVAALAVFVFGAAKAGYSYFSKGFSASVTVVRPAAPAPRPVAAAPTPATARGNEGLPDDIVPAKKTTIIPMAEAQAFAAAINAAAGGSGTNAAVNANAGSGAALQEVSQQAAEVAKSAELHKATASLWAQAWEKSWPFIRDMIVKFFGLFKALWYSLTHVGKGSGGNVNWNAPVNGDASVNANVAP